MAAPCFAVGRLWTTDGLYHMSINVEYYASIAAIKYLHEYILQRL